MSIVDVLALRGVRLSPSQRARIAECESLDTLERLYAAAKSQPVDSIDLLG